MVHITSLRSYIDLKRLFIYNVTRQRIQETKFVIILFYFIFCVTMNTVSNKKGKNSSGKQQLEKKPSGQTDVYLHDKHLQDIVLSPGDLSNLTVLYLQNNYIKRIENLDNLFNLKCLYLEKNDIEKIEGLETLGNLEKLYIGYNYISVVEGLENLTKLQELHIEKQRLPRGADLCFDPRTVRALSTSLQVLDVSSNKMSSIYQLNLLKGLEEFYCANNNLDNLQEVGDCLVNWFSLKIATFTGNPISKHRNYRETIIANAYCLESLDYKNILAATRIFYKNLYKAKSKGLKKNINLADYLEGIPQNLPISIQNVASTSVIKKNGINALFPENGTTSNNNEEHGIYIPWKKLTSVKKIRPLYKKKLCKTTVVTPTMVIQ